MPDGRREEALAAYQESLATREKLAAADPGNTERQRDLLLSHNNIGNVLVAVGRREEALAAYRKFLAISEKLAAAHPGETEWQHDLSVSHEKIGDVLVAAGRREEALAAYQKSLGIREKLDATDPGNVMWQTDLVVSHVKMAVASDEKRENFDEALSILRRLDAAGTLPSDKREWIPMIELEIKNVSER
jgi:tetratricopeptide (TPR) repeat protein